MIYDSNYLSCCRVGVVVEPVWPIVAQCTHYTVVDSLHVEGLY